ncbi:MAG: hypothetical protein B7Y25_08005 [Alphaproteobacteria bacterium 16-39-46]|nr:MAG: hypothetical protein B7Y25_08005 [Alphaproteobacteria bacterium 16-39-46]OZA41341.1 MAG: hypothetical protein B7X84_08180 [Alphaproteobacteria bacterium 17-39-52]HQS84832.1 hypothetical protein [Alphaproteobacteria bacterium]HQS94626.1 hypothetical protein [Alphaproteobacteria bacterium]
MKLKYSTSKIQKSLLSAFFLTTSLCYIGDAFGQDSVSSSSDASQMTTIMGEDLKNIYSSMDKMHKMMSNGTLNAAMMAEMGTMMEKLQSIMDKGISDEMCTMCEKICAMCENMCAMCENMHAMMDKDMCEKMCAMCEKMCTMCEKMCTMCEKTGTHKSTIGKMCTACEKTYATCERILSTMTDEEKMKMSSTMENMRTMIEKMKSMQ